MQKLVEFAALIPAKRFPTHKTAPPIERQRRIKRGATTGFETQPFHPSRSRNTDNMLQQSGSDAATEKVRVHTHGLELPRCAAQLLEGSNTRNGTVVPCRPDRHARRR